MTSPINKEVLEHLAKLARIEFAPEEEDKLIQDLGQILDHFKELGEIDTAMVVPMTGGTDLRNVFRDDDGAASTNCGAGVEDFPEKKGGFLKIPPVFE